jgi:rSAM/selenodomain-associated transferase 1
MLEDAIAVTTRRAATSASSTGPGRRRRVTSRWRRPECARATNRACDLGERLARAFDDLLVAPGDRAVILGADCPALDSDTLREAFAALAKHDAVLGPARDGGYYLIGLRRRSPDLFRDIEWSTARVLDQTVARAAQAGVTVQRLAALDDLDTPEDLLRWIACRAGGGGPSTPRALDRTLRALGLLPPA